MWARCLGTGHWAIGLGAEPIRKLANGKLLAINAPELPQHLIFSQVVRDIRLTGHLGYLQSTHRHLHHLLYPKKLQFD